jgi:hypothetical protein
LGLPITSIGVEARRHDHSPDEIQINWGAHADGACSVSCPTSDAAAAEIEVVLYHHPAERAAEMRAQAEKLNLQAETLETVAKLRGEKPQAANPQC